MTYLEATEVRIKGLQEEQEVYSHRITFLDELRKETAVVKTEITQRQIIKHLKRVRSEAYYSISFTNELGTTFVLEPGEQSEKALERLMGLVMCDKLIEFEQLMFEEGHSHSLYLVEANGYKLRFTLEEGV